MGVNYKHYLVYDSIVQNLLEKSSTATILKSDEKGKEVFLLSYRATSLKYFDTDA